MAKEKLKLLGSLPPYNGGKLTLGIFKYQKALVKAYITLGKLPPLEVNLMDRNDQNFLRKLMGDFIEELAEASEIYHIEVLNMFRTSIYTEPESQKELRTSLRKFTEEMMDALHFLVEICLYFNIDNDDLLQAMGQDLDAKGLPLKTEDAMTTALWYGRHCNIQEDDSRSLQFSAFKLPLDLNDVLLAGCYLSEPLIIFSMTKFWEITQSMYLARNYLKIKDWRDASVQTEVRGLQLKIVDTWIRFFQLLDLVGLNEPKSIYYHYEKKNLINQQRIKDKY